MDVPAFLNIIVRNNVQAAMEYPSQVAGDVGWRIRPLQPGDKGRLVKAFQRLSPATRYRRWHGVKKALTPQELQILTEPDGINHFALGAIAVNAQGQEGDCLGVTQLTRLTENAELAEAAIWVADVCQRRGIGQGLLEQLMAAAGELGVVRFRCHVLADNHEMRSLIDKVCWDLRLQRDGILLTADFFDQRHAERRQRRGYP